MNNDELTLEYQELTTTELNKRLNAFNKQYKMWFECNQFTLNSYTLRVINQHTKAIQNVLKNKLLK